MSTKNEAAVIRANVGRVRNQLEEDERRMQEKVKRTPARLVQAARSDAAALRKK